MEAKERRQIVRRRFLKMIEMFDDIDNGKAVKADWGILQSWADGLSDEMKLALKDEPQS